MRSLNFPNSNPFMTCTIDPQSTLCPFSLTQWILYLYAFHALYIYQYHVGPLILDAYQTHTLSYIFSMPLWLCSELQGDLIFDAPSISTSYKYVKSSLFFKYWYTSSLLALKLFMFPLWVHHSWRYLLIILSRLKFYLDSILSSICTLMPSLVFSNLVSKYLQYSCIIVPKLIKNHLLVLKCHTLISITPMITHLQCANLLLEQCYSKIITSTYLSNCQGSLHKILFILELSITLATSTQVAIIGVIDTYFTL